MKAAIVGAGFISKYHIDAINREPNVNLVAICDLRRKAAESLVRSHESVSVYVDLQEMLNTEKPNVVHILTQPDSHFFLAKMVLESGAHAIIEKPVTTNSEEALKLEQIAKNNNVSIAINHNFVFSRPFNRLKSVLDKGELGPLKSIRIVWKKTLPQMSFGPWNLWMLREPGNILFETGSHSLSELLSIIGNTPVILNVDARKPKTLPSGSVFFQRWNISASSGDTYIQIDTAFDHGYDQHFVEVEGLFGVARADVENDYFVIDQPTGKEYDFERFSINKREGKSRKKQSIQTFLSYAGSKLSKSFTGNPYETSMLLGIKECYRQLANQSSRTESSIGYAIQIAKTAETILMHLPQVFPSEAPALPVVAKTPTLDAKTLIIGASGFIGKKLLLALVNRGEKVRAMVRNNSSLVGVPSAENLEIIVGDFRDTALMEKALDGIESVVHLAVAHGNSLDDYLIKDSIPTIEFAKQCLKKKIKRFVYTGTIDSLDLSKNHLIKESDGVDSRIRRRNNYGHSKAITESQLKTLYKEQGFPVVIVRPAIVVGEGGPVMHVGVANWSGLGYCTFWGDGLNKIPLVLVDDIVKGINAVLDTPGIEGNTYNLSAQSCVSASEYVNEVEKVLNCKIRTHTRSATKPFFTDFIKWIIKVAARHPDKRRIPSIHDWKCREQHAGFDTSTAQNDLGWIPTNDRQTIIEKGIIEPAKKLLQG